METILCSFALKPVRAMLPAGQIGTSVGCSGIRFGMALQKTGGKLTTYETGIEIDVLEQYGVNPNALCTKVHLW